MIYYITYLHNLLTPQIWGVLILIRIVQTALKFIAYIFLLQN